MLDYSISTKSKIFDYAQWLFPSVPFFRLGYNYVTDDRCVFLSGCLGTVFFVIGANGA